MSTNALGRFNFSVVDAQGSNMTNSVGIRIMAAVAPAQPPILAIRNQSGVLLLELTVAAGRSLTVQSKTNLSNIWLNWTNVTASGTMQLLPLDELTNQSPRYFRTFAH